VFTAAAVKVPLNDSKIIERLLSKRQEWQRDAWGYYDETPEVKFAINFLANGIGKVRYFAACYNAEGEVVPVDDPTSPLVAAKFDADGVVTSLELSPLAQAATQEIERLRAPTGGQGELNRMIEANIEVAGECFLHGQDEKTAQGIPGDVDYRPYQPESWDVRSVSEIESTGKSLPGGHPEVLVHDTPGDKGRPIDDTTEGLIRMWQRHPQWSKLPDCHMRALISDLEGLALMTAQQKAESKSRLSAPLVLVPVELGLTDQPAPTGDDSPDEGGDPVEQGGQQNGLLEAITNFATTPVDDPTDVATLVGLIISGQANYLRPDVFRTMDLSRPPDMTLDQKIEKKIDRVARGLNVPVEVVMGHMSTTFSNAEQIDQDVYEDHFEPRVQWLAEAYTTGFLHPNLSALFGADVDVTQVFAWPDISGLVSDQDVNPDEAHSRGVISDAAYRRMKSIPEDDAPDDVEWARNLAARKGIFTEALTREVLILGGVDVAMPSAAPEAAPGVAPAAMVLLAAARANPGRRLMSLDVSLRDRLLGAAESALDRALEKAGNRLRSSQQLRPRLRGLADMRWAANELGPALIADAGFTADVLLEDAWAALETQFNEWVTQAGADALTIVEEITGNMSRARRAEMQLRLLENKDEAWKWLSTNMSDLAKRQLFDPETIAIAEAAGELSLSSRVPPGLVREALSRAGGAALRGEAGNVKALQNTPIGMLATGGDITDALTDGGARIDAFQWVYGAAQRKTFEPHLALNGTVFANFDDPVLTNTDGWPDTPYFYPGDHNGCVCDFEPIVITPEEVAAHTTQIEDVAEVEKPGPAESVDWSKKRAAPLNDVVKKALREAKATKTGEPVMIRNLNYKLGSAYRRDITSNAIAVERHGFKVLVEVSDGNMSRAAMNDYLDRHEGLKDLEVFSKQLTNKGRAVTNQISYLDARNPDDLYWSKKYGGRDFLSAATANMNSGEITYYNGGTGMRTLRHEYGHLVDGARGPSTLGYSDWLDAGSLDAARGQSEFAGWIPRTDASHRIVQTGIERQRALPNGYEYTHGITDYGRANNKEDFAESMALYMADQRYGSVGRIERDGRTVSLRFADIWPARASLLDEYTKGLLK
jgi:hypothetical protein